MKLQTIIRRLKGIVHGAKAFSSQEYWTTRYASGRNSGPGSYGHLADFKAKVLNEFITTHSIQTVIEFGSGDGNQVALANYPYYVGYDVSQLAIKMCRTRFSGDASKRFYLVSEYDGHTADLALSLDVIFHLVEDGVFETYMRQLFMASTRFVIIYSSNQEDQPAETPAHVRHRHFTEWINRNIGGRWALNQTIPNQYTYNGDYHATSFANFYIFEKLN